MSKTLRSYFPNYLSTDAIFTKMSVLGAPWSNEVGQDMDDAYFTMYSGIKNPSEFVTLHLNPGVDTANAMTIARILWGIYGQNWTRLWEAFNTQYTPIDNYNVQETISRTQQNDRNINRTNNLTSTVDGTENRSGEQDGTKGVTGSTSDETTSKRTIEGQVVTDRAETITTTGSTSSDTTSEATETSSLQHGEVVNKVANAKNYSYGFNSTDKVPTSEQDETGSDTHSGTDTTTTTTNSKSTTIGTSKNDTTNDTVQTEDTNSTENITSNSTGTNKSDTTDHQISSLDITTKDTRTDKTVEDTTDTDDIKEDIQRTRTGNIGQNSYQELLSQEFELWRWNFFTAVFEDVDKFLVLPVYDTCSHFS